MKISFCTTCKGRLDQLKQTLPANLAAEAHNTDVEFVVLDYGCPDAAGEWLKANFKAEIESSRLRVARHGPAPVWNVAHAKNMTVRLATGAIVCNLDADVSLIENTSKWLGTLFDRDVDSCVAIKPMSVRGNIVRKARSLVDRAPSPKRDLHGFIAVSKRNFEMLGGYDEHLLGGWADINLGVGARRAGLSIIMWPRDYWPGVTLHDDDLRMRFLSAEHKLVWETRQRQSRLAHIGNGVRVLRGRRQPVVNADGQVGCGEIYLNFDDTPSTVDPLPPRRPHDFRHKLPGASGPWPGMIGDPG